MIRQIIAIPRRLDLVALFASLSFNYYVTKWIEKTKYTDARSTTRFANIFRFIDDLTMLKNSIYFYFLEVTLKFIYCRQVKLK